MHRKKEMKLNSNQLTIKKIAICTILAWAGSVFSQNNMALLPAQESAVRKALTERLPNMPKIDEISRSAMPGLL